MRISSTSRPLGRRVLAASAGFGLALALTACTIGETGNDDETAAAPTTAATSAQQTDQESTSSAPPADESDVPDTPVDQLVLGAEDAPELGLRPISAEEISGGMDTLSGLAEEMRVEPSECADFNQNAVLKEAAPEVVALQAGQTEQFPVSVGVTRDLAGIPDRSGQVKDCPTMTITMPLKGVEVTAEARNALIDVDAPEGVEQFTAMSQETTMDVMGTPLQSGNVMITGTIRGIGVSVTATGAEGPVSDSARDTAIATFVKQVDKIRAA